MSIIQERIDRTERDGVTFSTNDIIEYSPVEEIKEWADYMRKKIKDQQDKINELTKENVELQVKLEKYE